MNPGTVVLILATAYAPSCGATGLTSSGARPAVGWTIAADPAVFRAGTILDVEGLGQRMVQDTGSAIRLKHVDVFMATCGEAVRFGVQRRRAVVVHVPKKGN